MKTLRYRIGNEVKPGILDNENNIRDVTSLVNDWDDLNLHVDKLNIAIYHLIASVVFFMSMNYLVGKSFKF